MKDWLIKILGGVTKDEQEILRAHYEKWSMKHLKGKNGEVIPDCSFYALFDGDDILILRSRISVMNGLVKNVRIAPWCKDVIVSGNIIQANEDQSNAP